MSITLVTGSPGAGKTLYMVKHLVDVLIPLGRPIYTNIIGLDVDCDHVFEIDIDTPKTWHSGDFEDGSIFIFDEVQQHYPPRNSMSKVPPYISAYEVHRHRGFDFFFLTQGPRLIDRHLHDLTTEHIHLYRSFKMKSARIYKWNSVNPNPEPAQSKKNSVQQTFHFPKKYFDYYKSASEHNMKVQIPWRPIVWLGSLLLVLAGVLFFISTRFGGGDTQKTVDGYLKSEVESMAVGSEVSPPCHFFVVGFADEMYLLKDGKNQIHSFDVDSFSKDANGNTVIINQDRWYGVCRNKG